jgi:hypothetical protein
MEGLIVEDDKERRGGKTKNNQMRRISQIYRSDDCNSRKTSVEQLIGLADG